MRQQIITKIFSTAENNAVIDDETVGIPINANFNVKLVKISFSYNFSANGLINMTVTANELDGDLVGSLNNFVYEHAGVYYFGDSPKKSNQFTYVFPKPKQLNGNITLKFQQILASVIATANVVVHIELWG